MQTVWPPGLILDEIWLKSRRTLVQLLSAEGLWIEDEVYREFMNHEADLGFRLKHELLSPILKDDYPLIGSGSIFGSFNRRFRNRLPFCMAFGYSLGHHIAQSRGYSNEKVVQAGKLSSLFNLGISVVDVIHDSSVCDRPFKEWLPADIIFPPSSGEGGGLIGSGTDQAEHRLALKIISGFLHLFSETVRNSLFKKRLMSLLGELYRAEEQSTAPQPHRESLSTSFKKSAGPFIFLDQMILGMSDCEGKRETAFGNYGRQIGTSFWLLDDIVDLVEDYQNNSLNCILVKNRHKENGHFSERQERNGSVDELLTNRIVDETCRKFVSTAKKSLLAIGSNSEFKRFYLAYIRDWMS